MSAASDLPFPAVWISLYYVAFYVVMTGIFALCIYSLMCTLDPYTPDYQDQLKSPGNRGDARSRSCWSEHELQRGPSRRSPSSPGWASALLLPLSTGLWTAVDGLSALFDEEHDTRL